MWAMSRTASRQVATGTPRNGTTQKTLICEHGKVPIDAPRDRDGSFEPKIVRKRQRRFVGFDDKILALYSRGLSSVTSTRTCMRSTVSRSAWT